MKDAKEKTNARIEYYYYERPHSSLNDQTPNEVYEGKPISLAVLMILSELTFKVTATLSNQWGPRHNGSGR